MLDDNSNSELGDNCVVCCRGIKIYAYGVCDHVVCYECSTRMRVLCQQNECPICRQDMPQVVFAWKLQRFTETAYRHWRSDKKHNISFEDDDAFFAYRQLLEFVCTLCENKPAYNTFYQLKEHARREHEHYFCDLCVDNLKIFCFERKTYSRQELARHRRVGDPDNTSHRGHPLCEFCDERYLDRDELFRHLRKDHFFCHFCDADGLHEFYPDYEFLREHFQKEHFLCEEGTCIDEKFTAVFRTDIDLRAHKATVHNRTMTKQQAKQARTLDFEFNLAPRGRGTVNGTNAPVPETQESDNRRQRPFGSGIRQSTSGRRGRSHQEMEEVGAVGGAESTDPTTETSAEVPAMDCSEAFPSLGVQSSSASGGGGTRSGGNESFATRFAKQNRFTVRSSGNNNTEDEDFPSLQPSSSPSTQRNTKSAAQQVRGIEDFSAIGKRSITQSATASAVNSRHSMSAVLQASRTKKVNTESKVHAHDSSGADATSSNVYSSASASSSRPQTAVVVKKLNATSLTEMDFPELAGSSGATAEAQWVTARSSKQTRSKSETSKKTPQVKLTKNDFPGLTEPTKKPSSNKLQNYLQKNSDNSAGSEKTLQSVAESLLLSGSNCDKNVKNSKGKDKKPKGSNGKSADQILEKRDQKASSNTLRSYSESNKRNKPSAKNDVTNLKTADENQENEKPTPRKAQPKAQTETVNSGNSKKKEKVFVLDDFPSLPEVQSASFDYQEAARNIQAITWKHKPKSVSNAPPGFVVDAKPATVRIPPPGFNGSSSSNTLKNFDPSALMFNNGMDSFPMSVPLQTSYKYSEPENFQQRNFDLITRIQVIMGKDDDIFKAFKVLSGQFRQGTLGAERYYKDCIDLAGLDSFSAIFPELLVLLPDIPKQQELLTVHNTYCKKKKNSKNKSTDENLETKESQFLVCATCQQVLASKDFRNHMIVHGLDNDFPSLFGAVEQKSNNHGWGKK